MSAIASIVSLSPSTISSSELDDYELDMHWREALSRYAERHENHCIGFAEEMLARAERTDLADSVGPTQAELVEYLDTGIVERDFTTLF